MLPILNNDQAKYYENIILFLRGSIKLGHFYIKVGVDLPYCYLDQPQKVHLDPSLHVFSYLKSYSCYRIVFDSNAVS